MPASESASPPRKAVIPAAGFGTRFLPAAKAVPKELFPVVDIPALQYIVEEAVGAGLGDVLVVTGRGKDAIADHFDRAPELEAALVEKGDDERLQSVIRPAELANMQFVRQGEPKGLGHAVLCSASYVGSEPFAVMLGDDLIDARDPLLSDDARGPGCPRRDAWSRCSRCRAVRSRCTAAWRRAEPMTSGWCAVTDLVEKPEPEDAPSNLAIIGRYVLSPRIFDVLRNTPPGRGGEIQLTDALLGLVEAGEPVHGVVFRGRRYDTGDRGDYLRAIVRLACDREDIGPEFRRWLEDFVAGRA